MFEKQLLGLKEKFDVSTHAGFMAYLEESHGLFIKFAQAEHDRLNAQIEQFSRGACMVDETISYCTFCEATEDGCQCPMPNLEKRTI